MTAIDAHQIPAYTGTVCTKREHRIDGNIDSVDERRFACDCRSVMIGNGHIEIRYGILDRRFPS
jgi:hypothetical protein